MAASQHKQQFVLNVHLYVIIFTCCAFVYGQNDQRGRYYGTDGASYVPPNPGDRDYKTFTYNNRRYGLPQNNYYGRGGNLDPSRIGGVPPVDRYPYDPVSYFRQLKLLVKHSQICQHIHAYVRDSKWAFTYHITFFYIMTSDIVSVLHKYTR